MMLVVAPAEDQQTTTMETKEDDYLRGKPPTVDDGENDTETDTGLSSSELDHQQRGERTGRRSNKPGSSGMRRRKSKSPSRHIAEAKQGKSSSTTRVKPTRGAPSRSRSMADEGDYNHRGGKSRHNRRLSEVEGTPVGEEEGNSQRAKHSSKASSNRKGHSTSASATAKRTEGSKGDRDAAARNRRRKSDHLLSEAKEGKESFSRSQTTSGVPRKDRGERTSDSASMRRHRSKSRSRSAKGDGDKDATERSGRSIKSEKSSRSERTSRISLKPTQEESTLDSTPTAAKTATAAASSPDEPPDASLSLRSSVKVASALVKFRKVLAMSKQASASAQKYKNDQEKQTQDIGMENLGNIDTTSSVKENSKSQRRPGSSHHRRDGETSRHSKHRSSSSHHRRKSEHGESSTRSKRKTKERSPSPKRTTQSSSAKKNDPSAVVDADAFLKEALTNVGKRLSSRASLTKKDSDDKKEEPAATSSSTATSRESAASDVRLKSSAKVSTAVLKFQQALALSKSATQAAKTQQDTQNKLLGEVHADKNKADDYLVRANFQSKPPSTSVEVSPVSAVDVHDPAKTDSPKVPTDLDDDIGDSDIDSEIEIDDVDEDDDPISDVETDSEDEDDFAAKVEASNDGIMEIDNLPEAPVPVAVVSTDSSDVDLESESDVDDHSEVELDSDDDLDSDEELDDSNALALAATTEDDDEEAKDDNMGNVDDDDDTNSDASGAAMDSDDDLDSNCGDAEATDASNGMDLEAPKPAPSSSNENGIEASMNQNGSTTDAKTNDAEPTIDGDDDLGEKARRQLMNRSLSFNASLNGSQSLMDQSLTDWKSARDVTAPTKGPGLAMLTLNRGGESQASIMTEEDSQAGLTYLPMSMTKPELGAAPDDFDDDHLVPKPEKSLSSQSTSKPSRRDLSRKSSNRSMRKSKSMSDQHEGKSMGVDEARKILKDDSLGRRTRSSSRMRKPPSRSKSTCSTADGESSSQRKSKSSSSGGSKGSDRARSKRSSSASRSRTLSGLSSFSQAAATSTKGSSSEKREDGRKPPSSRRRTPNRAKSHDGRPSRSVSRSRNPDKDSKEKRIRKTLSTKE